MAVYNTSADAANTAVRAFLTRIGEYYLGRPFNTLSGKGKQDWVKIRDLIFEGKCAYCGKSDSNLQMEHLVMFNREGTGLHHPGNIVPICSPCNKRSKNEEKNHLSWEDHLSSICKKNNDLNSFHRRWTKIKTHVEKGEFRYPTLSSEENKAISIIANNLYDSIKNEFEQAVKLFEDLDKAFTKK
ncbi:MAG: HNH endonuclease signature motif containing protein [Chitinophagaceae bacterium]